MKAKQHSNCTVAGLVTPLVDQQPPSCQNPSQQQQQPTRRKCRKLKVVFFALVLACVGASAFSCFLMCCVSRMHEQSSSPTQPQSSAVKGLLFVNTTTGDWSIDVQGTKWFSGSTASSLLDGVVGIGAVECEQLKQKQQQQQENGDVVKGCGSLLTPSSLRTYTGTDDLGDFSVTELGWNVLGTTVLTRFRVYNDSTTFVFEQMFPDGVSSTGSPGRSAVDGVLLKFPAVDVFAAEGLQQGYMQYQGSMIGDEVHLGRWDATSAGIGSGAKDTGPLAVFEATNLTTAVWSSASSFMAVNQAYDVASHTVGYGLLGSLTAIPPHFSCSIILSLSRGINHAMDSWGTKLRRMYQNKREYTDGDFGLNYLGYSTDNGAYYYYLTEQNKNYEDTLIDVKTETQRLSLPVRHILLDSWWYFKGVADGVKSWEARPDVFPNGLAYLYNHTKWPAVAHNRYWSSDTTYATQNGGIWKFHIDNSTGYAMPLQREFWDYLMETNKQWNLLTYEQDWLYNEFLGVDIALSDPRIARMWLMQMGDSAKHNGLTIQYCMAWSRHILQSLEIPVVTQARASGDYHPGNTQWQIGLTSIFAHAMRIRPSKDNWWSSPVPSWKDAGVDRETHNRLQSVVAILSTGPYTPGDKLGFMEVPLIMQGCTQDGSLLHPDLPATAIDANILNRADSSFGGPSGEVWSTHTSLARNTWFYVLAAESGAFDVLPSHVISCPHILESVQYVAFEANSTSSIREFSSSSPLSLPATDSWTFQLWTLAPRFENGWALLGEPSKWVSVSKTRFRHVVASANELHVSVWGAPGEHVTVNFLPPQSLEIVTLTCAVDERGVVTMVVPELICV